MCDWCVQHGAGKKWYLNMRNYQKDMYDNALREAANAFAINVEKITGTQSLKNWLNITNDEDFSKAVAGTMHRVGTDVPHRGQVVPIEDVKRIIDLSGPIARFACVCRRRDRASFDEKTCIPVGPGYLEYFNEWPDYTRGGIDYISKEEALGLMEDFNKKGYVATFWRDYNSPAVLGFCNCEFPTCGAIRGRRYYGSWYNFFLRNAEYVAKQDYDKCTGCKLCVSRCQFGALSYSPYLEKAIINMKRCAGCGLCRDICPQKAIRLVPREEVPAVRELW